MVDSPHFVSLGKREQKKWSIDGERLALEQIPVEFTYNLRA
jgi:hypothetical protein